VLKTEPYLRVPCGNNAETVWAWLLC